MAMGPLANEPMGNASGVFNLMRNTGSSIGIADDLAGLSTYLRNITAF
jgi:hypothetical protein